MLVLFLPSKIKLLIAKFIPKPVNYEYENHTF